jgi:carbon-monoxide dehydrogenase small subunit
MIRVLHAGAVAIAFPGGVSMRVPVTITINGRAYAREVEPRLLLVHFLRDVAGLTGTKIGCDTSQCGSCTVILDGAAVKACTCLAAQADGSAVITVEGLAPEAGQLHPLQEAFWAKHGLQCGFCTPGMLLASYALLSATSRPNADQIRHGLEGNMCRCTGYQNIVRSVQHAATIGDRP